MDKELAKDTSVKRRVFDTIQIGKENDKVSRGFDILIVVVIIINIIAMFMETFDELSRYHSIFQAIEIITVIFFILEYALRIWTSQYLYPDESKGKAAFKFITSFEGIVEICTILPFFFLSGFVAFRMLRVVRIFNLFRINANADSFNVIKSVLYEKRNQIFSSMFIIFVLMLAASLFMYSAEHKAQPDVFKNAFSGMWYTVSTILTIGYGDISPVTVIGKIMGILIGFLGVGVVAIPTGIISAGFVEQYTQTQNSTTTLDDIKLHTVVVDMDSAWIGYTKNEMKEYFNIAVMMAKRNDITIIPNDDYHVALGDQLVVYYEVAH